MQPNTVQLRLALRPTRVDDNVAYFKSEVLPRIKDQPGFQAVRQMINRETGQGAVGTVWADQKAMQAWAKEAEVRREEAGKARGIEFSEPSFREVVLCCTGQLCLLGSKWRTLIPKPRKTAWPCG